MGLKNSPGDSNVQPHLRIAALRGQRNPPPTGLSLRVAASLCSLRQHIYKVAALLQSVLVACYLCHFFLLKSLNITPEHNCSFHLGGQFMFPFNVKTIMIKKTLCLIWVEEVKTNREKITL